MDIEGAKRGDSVSRSCQGQERTGPSFLSVYENRMVLVLAAAGGVAALDAQAVFYLMPFIADEFSLSGGEVGFIGSAVLIGWALGGLVIARASDRAGVRLPFLIGAFLCFALLSGLSAAAVGFFSLLIARLLIGVAEGPVIPVKQALVICESTPSRRALNMGIVQNFGAQLIGSLLAPIALVALAEAAGWRWAFLTAGLPGLLIAILIWRVLREPPRAAAADKAEVSGDRWQDLVANRNIVLCALIALAAVGWFFILLTFLPLYLTRDLHVSASVMSVIMGVIGLAGVTSSLIVPYFADRFGRRMAIIAFSALGLLAPVGVLLAGSSMITVVLVLVCGCQMLGIFPLLMGTVPQESTSPANGATASSLVIAVAQIGGGAAGPMAAGWLAEQSGNSAALVLSGILAVCALTLAPFLTESRPGHGGALPTA
ncbi:MFS transporter [Alteraurantiacibacter buctensis]|uniref:MFS transporter n=1 Tax=Alteraurantiacibacter buctensis TaxID=1503981 RepID=A0A844Z1J2_9SPHN|nr:MFS transporter [Alteraurantiacibacter buctensis]MXO73020.1 MFS transporter [Alteraurantiacibacter buctensis]